jgi:preprotein translocase subunit SecB
MKISPLQLNQYFITDLMFTVNREHKPDVPVKLTVSDLDVQPTCLAHKDKPRAWQVTLRITQKPVPEANAPYSFSMELVGFFEVAEAYPAEKVAALVKTNGSSILYGAAREILKSATAMGPFRLVLLPTVSFYTDETKKVLSGKTTPAPAPAAKVD